MYPVTIHNKNTAIITLQKLNIKQDIIQNL